MSRLEQHIANYAKAIEDHDWGGRAYFHKELCDHLGICHSELQPFEGRGLSLRLTRAQAARVIRDAIDKFKKRNRDL